MVNQCRKPSLQNMPTSPEKKSNSSFCLECFQEDENFRDVTMDDDTLVDGSGTAADDSALFKTPAAPTRGTKRRQIDDLASAVSGVAISAGQVQFGII